MKKTTKNYIKSIKVTDKDIDNINKLQSIHNEIDLKVQEYEDKITEDICNDVKNMDELETSEFNYVLLCKTLNYTKFWCNELFIGIIASSLSILMMFENQKNWLQIITLLLMGIFFFVFSMSHLTLRLNVKKKLKKINKGE